MGAAELRSRQRPGQRRRGQQAGTRPGARQRSMLRRRSCTRWTRKSTSSKSSCTTTRWLPRAPASSAMFPVRVGDRVVTTTQLTTVDRPGSLEAYIYVPIEKSGQLKMNLPVQIVDGSGNLLATSRITFISPQVDTSTQTVLAKAQIANSNDSLRTAQFIRARVVWGTPAEAGCSGRGRLPNRRSLFRFCRRVRSEGWIRSPPEAAPGRPNRRQRLCGPRRREARRQGRHLRHPVSNRWQYP